MTLDQIFMRLTDCKKLRHRLGRCRPMAVGDVGTGPMKGRTADGKLIQGQVKGVSKAAAIRAKHAAAAQHGAAAAKKQAREERRARRRGTKT